ncbi:putative DNA binding domain-containing protein [Succinatimonas hippei]|uniref:RNA-binding domain-containing protein n=1 Tax=Succinatimonas hippei TaxID=626938 RepID=UPI0020111C8B|nr:RNA-binding domain-containing protein [Succinatimonas hippei]MCL1603896.1 putative DNA binding domain-containing protein [Succinatimonas hippei]
MNQEDDFSLSRFLDQLLKKHPYEDECIEFKSNIYQKDQNEISLLGEYISALANSAALTDRPKAYFILGVDDNGNICGTDFNPYIKLSNGQFLKHWLMQKLSKYVSFKISYFAYIPDNDSSAPSNKIIVIFEIDAASSYPIEWDKKRYIRLGSSKKLLAEYPEVERKLWKKLEHGSYATEIALNNLKPEQVFNLLDVNSYFSLLNIQKPTEIEQQLSYLSKEKFIIPDGNLLAITNLGAILLAQNLENFPYLQHKRLRIAVYMENDKASRSSEQRCDKGYACGFSEALRIIATAIPHSEQINLNTGTREPWFNFSLAAIRETMANALIHQDMTRNEAPMVEIFPSRIEITNPGKAQIPISRFIDLSARCINPEIAYFMVRARLCEERGTGIDKAVIDCEKTFRNAPKFEQLPPPMPAIRVTLYPAIPFSDLTIEDKVRTCYQHCCICYMQRDYMTNSSLRQRFNLDAKDMSIISRIIKISLEKELIKIENPDQGVRLRKYVPFWASLTN